jgi:antitoxin VapB
MSLNIKNPETHRLAAELAEQKGLSMTQVITDALRKELADKEPSAHALQKFERAMKIVMEMRELIGPKGLPDHAELLYDADTGLPK